MTKCFPEKSIPRIKGTIKIHVNFFYEQELPMLLVKVYMTCDAISPPNPIAFPNHLYYWKKFPIALGCWNMQVSVDDFALVFDKSLPYSSI